MQICSVWSSHLVYVNGLYLSGTVQALIMVDSHTSFPHISKIAATFTSKQVPSSCLARLH